jgi:hypothetical protein
MIGYEPAYMYENGLLIYIFKDKEKSFIEYLKSWGMYGSGLVRRSKIYRDYTRKSKFVKFVDKYHKKLYEKN